jgi:hypothetical protein
MISFREGYGEAPPVYSNWADSVTNDLPAWCRLVGHELVRHEGDRYLIRGRG